MDSWFDAPHIPFMSKHRHILPLVVGLGLLAGCVASSPFPPPPDLIVETIPMPPVSAEPLRWRPGYWNWTGNGYVWTQGQFVPQSTAGTHWLQGHWVQSGSGWVWKPAGWVM
jgi:hypothetical protein